VCVQAEESNGHRNFMTHLPASGGGAKIIWVRSHPLHYQGAMSSNEGRQRRYHHSAPYVAPKPKRLPIGVQRAGLPRPRCHVDKRLPKGLGQTISFMHEEGVRRCAVPSCTWFAA
jgi:hypothetical protein